MEYFRIVNVKSSEFQLQSQLTLANLDEVSTEIFNLGSPGEHETSIGEPESVVIHLTINRQEKDQEFIEEIIDFLDDHCENLKHFLSNSEIRED